MRKRSYLQVFLWILMFSFIVSACSTKQAQPTPTASSTLVIEIITASNTPIPLATSTPSPSVTLPQVAVTDEMYPEPETLNEPVVANVTPNPYPMALPRTQPPVDVQQPYPEPNFPVQTAENQSNAQQPYPGPAFPLQDFDEESGMNNPYPPPMGGVPGNPTQPIALNPIQTPNASLTATNNTTGRATSTAIVRTGLRATDPKLVQLASGKYQFIEFFAFWCPTCKSMAPVINGLEWKYQDRISFVYLDIDDPANKSFKNVLGYKYQPHFFLVDGQGKIINQWLGYVPLENFEAVLMPLFP